MNRTCCHRWLTEVLRFYVHIIQSNFSRKHVCLQLVFTSHLKLFYIPLKALVMKRLSKCLIRISTGVEDQIFYLEFTNYFTTPQPLRDVLSFIKVKHPWVLIVHLAGKYQEARACLLSQMCTEKLVMAISVIEGRCVALNCGDIKVSKLRELAEYEQKFIPLVDLIKNADFNGKMVAKLIHLRNREVAEVQQKADLISRLTSVCHSLPHGIKFFLFSLLQDIFSEIVT